MKSKIVLKLTLYFVIAQVLFSFVLCFIFILLFRKHTMEIHQLELETKAVSIAGILSETNFLDYLPNVDNPSYKDEHFDMFFLCLDQVVMADVWIINKDFKLLSHPDICLRDMPESSKISIQKVFLGETTNCDDFSCVLGTPSLTIGTPIWDKDGGIAAALLLHSPISGIDTAASHGFTILISSIAIALVFAIIFSGLLSYGLAKPLKRMENTALLLAEGNYTVKTGVHRKDEIGQLAKVMDHLAEQLNKVDQERTRLEQMRHDFITNISHELRTPVTVLRGSIESLMDKIISSPEMVIQYYEQMLAETLHMERLINDLLDLCRLQNAEFQLDMHLFYLSDIVADVGRSMRQAASDKYVSVTVSDNVKDFIYYGDYRRIRQMLIIIMDNALKFSSSKQTVFLSLQKREENAEISISDHGCGIFPEELPFIFDRFYKSDNDKNRNGTGLGLPIARQIANRHNIEIKVSSCYKEGTTFELLFSNNSYKNIFLEREM